MYNGAFEKIKLNYRAQKCCQHGKAARYDRQNQPGSLKEKDHPNQRGLLQAHPCRLFLPESVESAHTSQWSAFKIDPLIILNILQKAFWRKPWPSPTWWFTVVLDLSELVSASSKGGRFRLFMSSLFLNILHMMGVIQAKVVKDRKPALSRGWDLDMETPTSIRSAPDKMFYNSHRSHWKRTVFDYKC